MKRLLFATTTGLLLAGCSTQNIKDVLTNLDKDCARHYTFSASTGVPANATVAGTIDCLPSGQTKAPAAPSAAPATPTSG